MRYTTAVLVAFLLAGAHAPAQAQRPTQGPSSPAASATTKAHDAKRFSGIAPKLGTTPEALAAAFEAARQQNPALKHSEFMVANVLAHNLGGSNSKVTAQALLDGLRSGKTIRQTLETLGLSAADAKQAEHAARREVKEAEGGPKAARD